MNPFTPDALLSLLESLRGVTRLRVALSGGLDSMVLLRALHELRGAGCLRAGLDALHVHHGLSPDADAWSAHCEHWCLVLEIPVRVCRVTVDPGAAAGPEAAARHARYAALEREIVAGDCLLTAHHADDQAETLLLQLLRGAGPHGLAAMPEVRDFGAGRLARPLLPFRRDQLAAWATAKALEWVEDASNRHLRFDRNFLRLQAMPLLRERWPALAETLSRSARLCGEAAMLLDELAAADCERAATDMPRELRWPVLSSLSTTRRRNLLRHWIARCGFPLPNAKRLERMAREFWEAAPDRQPATEWGSAELHRYRDRLCLMSRRAAFDPALVVPWDLSTPLPVLGSGRLSAARHPGEGLAAARLGSTQVEVRFRHGGERCRPAGRSGTHPLKKLLQELDVPPWWRDRIPLIYLGDELIAVADRLVCEGYAAAPGEPGWRLIWEPDAS